LRHDVGPPPVGTLDDKDVSGFVLPRRARGHVCPHVRGRGPSLGRPQGEFDLRQRKAGVLLRGSVGNNTVFEDGVNGGEP
jgi:hypothetical protein